MLQIMNPRTLQLSHNGGSDNPDIELGNYWENAKPLIEELEQTVNFAERKCGDLMQQLNLCKEYYEKWSTERIGTRTHKRKTKKRFTRRMSYTRSSSCESDKLRTGKVNLAFNKKLREKIYEITNEIKEANKKIVMKDPNIEFNPKPVINEEYSEERKEFNEVEWNDAANVIANHATKSEPVIVTEKQENTVEVCQRKESSVSVKKSPKRVSSKKRLPLSVKYTRVQKYKLRSKSLPQGVRRKFGFGGFVEVVDKQRPKFLENIIRIKSRTGILSKVKSNTIKSDVKPKTRPKTEVGKRGVRCDVIKMSEGGDSRALEHRSVTPVIQNTVVQAQEHNHRSCTNISSDLGSNPIKFSSTTLSLGDDSKFKYNYSISKQKSFLLAARQPIPFTICRTTKTFNLGLNIQQVLSMIKSKRHSTMLQAIIRDNITTARSVIQKTDTNVNALYIATSSRIARTESEVCPVRDDGENCLSVISSTPDNTVKCKMLTCRQSMGSHMLKDMDSIDASQMPIVGQIKFNELQRPEDVWVVEQPDSNRNFTSFRSRCTCFPTRQSVDYQKVLKQYSRMKENDRKSENFARNFVSANFPTGYMVSGPQLCSEQYCYTEKFSGPRIELKKIQEDLDNLARRYVKIQDHLTGNGGYDYELDAELESLELELNYREEDCKNVINFYNQLLNLKRNIRELRGKTKIPSNAPESKPPRSRKDPFRPTPSMTLTRVLRQIQCLQDKIKLIDAPSVT